jgi:hypothetical protein
VSEIPPSFRRCLWDYVEDFVDDRETEVICHECRSPVQVTRTKLEEGRGDWIFDWRCPKGHSLYNARIYIHVNYREPEFKYLK